MSFTAPNPADDLRKRIRDLDAMQVAPARALVDRALDKAGTEIDQYRSAIEDSRPLKLPIARSRTPRKPS